MPAVPMLFEGLNQIQHKHIFNLLSKVSINQDSHATPVAFEIRSVLSGCLGAQLWRSDQHHHEQERRCCATPVLSILQEVAAWTVKPAPRSRQHQY